MVLQCPLWDGARAAISLGVCIIGTGRVTKSSSFEHSDASFEPEAGETLKRQWKCLDGSYSYSFHREIVNLLSACQDGIL